MPPSISIIIPVYNVEHYVAKCIESILAQTFENFECLVIDDGSTDQSAAIIRQTIQQDQRFRLFTQTNKGQGVARNLGLEHAQGDYVCFVDSDDYIEKEYLEKLYKQMIKHNAKLCTCMMQHVNESGDDIRLSKPERCNQTFLSYLSAGFNHKGHNNTIHLYKTALFQHIRFPVKGDFFEDALTNAMILTSHPHEIVAHSDAVYYYLQREGSTTNSTSMEQCKAGLKSLNTMGKLLTQYGLNKSLGLDFMRFYLHSYAYLFVVNVKYSKRKNYSILFLAQNRDKKIVTRKNSLIQLFPISLVTIKRFALINLILSGSWGIMVSEAVIRVMKKTTIKSDH